MTVRVGLTGGIASGKSAVSARMAEHGAVIIDADQLARQVLAPGTDGLAQVVEKFGTEILDDDGALDRPALGRRVFGDDQARAELNAIVHPVLIEQLALRLLPPLCCTVTVPDPELTVVEVSVAAAFTDAFGLADEILAISGDPEVYGSEARARARKVKLDNAVAEYEATGTIPRVEKDEPAWP